MSGTAKSFIQREYERIKNKINKAFRPQKKEVLPQLALQPLRNNRK